jgi:periplasmic protein CpxP/Spy
MRRIHVVVAGALAGAALAVAAVTYAQPFGGIGPGVGHGFGPGMGMGGVHGRIVGVDPAAVDSRLGELKLQLEITPAQEDAWQSYVGAAKRQAASMQALRARMQEGTATTPERTQLMQQRSAEMTAMASALNGLYAVLTTEQKAILDQHRGPMVHRGMPFAGRTS